MYVNEVVAPRVGEEADLALAEKLHREGQDLDQIYETTGWFPGPDGEFRTQISDKSFALTGALAEQGHTTLGQAIEHDELFDIVPEVANTPVVHDPNLDSRGGYSPDLDMIVVRDADDAEAIAHEAQHAVQDALNFPSESRGSSIEEAGSREAYMANNGEIEAFEVMDHIGSAPAETPDLLEKAGEVGVGPRSPGIGMG